jgi:hypothetical protein
LTLFLEGPYLSCRRCAGLRYASQYEPKERRALERAKAIRVALGGEAGLIHPFPERPRGLHARTYERLRREVQEIEAAYVMGLRADVERMAARVTVLEARQRSSARVTVVSDG